MTPKFWKYLITNGDGSEIRFVAEEDREWAEKELEGNPRLLSYTAKPQFESAVFPLSGRSRSAAAATDTAANLLHEFSTSYLHLDSTSSTETRIEAQPHRRRTPAIVSSASQVGSKAG